MSTSFEHVVVGAGPLGAAAAKYLVVSGVRVLLLAPPESGDTSAHARSSSHADLSRLTRTLDADEYWARAARLSIERYRELERASGVSFFNEVGCLSVFDESNGENRAKMSKIETIAANEQVRHRRLVDSDLTGAFPELVLPRGNVGYFEPQHAGWLNPREYVRAQIAVGVQHGLEVWNEPMVECATRPNGVELSTSAGRSVSAGQALFAMGAHSQFDLPVPLDEQLTIYARTVVSVPLSDEQVLQLADLPSLIIRGARDDQNCYLVPPTRYPDGKFYIKIGGGTRARPLTSRDELNDWYAGEGDPDVAAALMARLEELLPVTRPRSGISQSCAITVTGSGLPRMTRLGTSVGLLTGGNGHAAKSGDEIGRLGSEMMLAAAS